MVGRHPTGQDARRLPADRLGRDRPRRHRVRLVRRARPGRPRRRLRTRRRQPGTRPARRLPRLAAGGRRGRHRPRLAARGHREALPTAARIPSDRRRPDGPARRRPRPAPVGRRCRGLAGRRRRPRRPPGSLPAGLHRAGGGSRDGVAGAVPSGDAAPAGRRPGGGRSGRGPRRRAAGSRGPSEEPRRGDVQEPRRADRVEGALRPDGTIVGGAVAGHPRHLQEPDERPSADREGRLAGPSPGRQTPDRLAGRRRPADHPRAPRGAGAGRRPARHHRLPAEARGHFRGRGVRRTVARARPLLGDRQPHARLRSRRQRRACDARLGDAAGDRRGAAAAGVRRAAGRRPTVGRRLGARRRHRLGRAGRRRGRHALHPRPAGRSSAAVRRGRPRRDRRRRPLRPAAGTGTGVRRDGDGGARRPATRGRHRSVRLLAERAAVVAVHDRARHRPRHPSPRTDRLLQGHRLHERRGHGPIPRRRHTDDRRRVPRRQRPRGGKGPAHDRRQRLVSWQPADPRRRPAGPVVPAGPGPRAGRLVRGRRRPRRGIQAAEVPREAGRRRALHAARRRRDAHRHGHDLHRRGRLRREGEVARRADGPLADLVPLALPVAALRRRRAADRARHGRHRWRRPVHGHVHGEAGQGRAEGVAAGLQLPRRRRRHRSQRRDAER